MRVLRFLWRGVLAFDRVGSRIPQLIQIWLIELFFVMPLAFFIGKVIDIHGAFGVPGTGEKLGGVFWGALAVACVTGFVFVRSLVRPKVVQGSWTPVVSADIGDYTVVAPNRRWTVNYVYLTSHPSYALLLLLTLPIPAVMVAATIDHGDSTFYFRITGIVGLIIVATMALMRVIAWYVLRFGRRELDARLNDTGMSRGRLGWEIAWKPVLMLIVLIYAIICIPIGYMMWQEKRTVDGLPVVTVADVDHVDQYRRVIGTVESSPIFWAPNGTGRGGNNYAGAGVLVALDDGGEALLLAESLSVPDFRGVLHDVTGGRLEAQGKVVDGITETQETYYGFDIDDFPEPSADGRVLVLLSYP